MRDQVKPSTGSGFPKPTSISEDEIWHALGHSPADKDDPFSLLDPTVRTTPAEPVGTALAEPVDVLEQLQREAEAALRDPNYVSAHAVSVAAADEFTPNTPDPDPLHALARAGRGKDSLLELLDGPASIEGLTEPLESLDGHELFAVRPAPDVLRLFAGDIVPTRQRDIAAPLTRREHHLVSMDSAYRPVQAQAQESGHDA
ncbi:hypothetical protein D9M68_264600 [compost metagenome]